MRALFSQLLDLLYPPKCVFCRRLLRPEEHDVCARCAHELEPIPAPLRRGQFYTECYAVYPYEGVVAESLRRFKFSGQSQYAASFGRMLAPLLRTAPFEVLTWVPVSAKRKMFFTSWKLGWTASAICRTSIFFWTGVGKTDARCPETLAFSVGQTTAEAKASIWICFWNGTRTVSAGQSIS